jgi:hypothetical protein
MPPKKRTARHRELTTAERMHAAVGTSPAVLLRNGLSPAQIARLEKEWDEWEAEHGFSFRGAAGIPTPADRARLDAGEEPGDPEPPEPPGFDLL